MNYDETNNYKINRKVLWLTKGENLSTYKDPKSPDGVLCHGMQGVFDPCNNPSDAWPIIFDNKIGVCHYSKWFAMHEGLGWDDHPSDKNPLRAAMICFLKINEVKQ